MRRASSKKQVLVLLFILCAVLFFWLCRERPPHIPAERYFDAAEAHSEEIRLAVLSPSPGSIRSLIELRNQGLIPLSNLAVIGVYHQMERTDYQKSTEFVKEMNLKWFHFHQIAALLTEDVLFQRNPCSVDFEEVFVKSDGIIFFGGADIPPYIYNDKTSLLTHIETPYRHFLELSFIFHLLGGHQDPGFGPFLESRPDFPVLGICLGAQSLNVGTGGTLVQDIWSEKYGKQYLEDVIDLGPENWHINPYARLYPEEKLLPYAMHPIRLLAGSKLCSELGFGPEETPSILSAHHQMVGMPGKGIRTAATSLDGRVVEAVEHEKYPHVLGVQFHPEFPILWDSSIAFRFTPSEKEKTSLPSYLDSHPPSSDFHKKLWAWFSQKLSESHVSRK